MKKIFILLSCLSIAWMNVNAQRICSSHEHQLELEQLNPALKKTREAIETFTQNYVNAMGAQSSRSVITIPVVVHVLYNEVKQNISDAQILSQIAILNADYRKANADISKVPSAFSSLAADCDIQFCLAQRDPNGAATTGIIRKATSSTVFGGDDKIKSSSAGGDDAWPSTSYLNIWVGNMSGGLLGYAQFPGGPETTDGVVINYTAFGNTGTAASPYNKGRTATHEVGHWLNLLHIWGDDGGDCTGSDNVADTPNQESENYGCPTYPHPSCSNTSDMFMNYMDYTEDACMNMFSSGQKARMQALFASGGSRASLLNSQGCAAATAGNNCGTPIGLTASNITSSTATLSWNAVAGAISYKISIKTSSASAWTTYTTTATALFVNNLLPSTLYNYQIQAICANGTSPNATSSLTTIALANVCNDSYEANNSLSAAKTIPVNTDIKALIGTSTDIDWFKFSNTTAQKNIKVTLSNLPLDYDVSLYNAAGTLLKTSANSGTSTESIAYNTSTVGNYYVKVFAYKNAMSSSSCYTLKATIGSNAFRLENGSDEESPSQNPNPSLYLYPNPSNGTFNVESMLPNQDATSATIRVINLLGNIVLSKELVVNDGYIKETLDISNFANGVYNVTIQSGEYRRSKQLFLTR